MAVKVLKENSLILILPNDLLDVMPYAYALQIYI